MLYESNFVINFQQNVNVTPNNVGEDQPGDANRLLDESRLKEIALDLLDKKKIPLVREQNPQVFNYSLIHFF